VNEEGRFWFHGGSVFQRAAKGELRESSVSSRGSLANVTIMTSARGKWYRFLGIYSIPFRILFDKLGFVQVDALTRPFAWIHWKDQKCEAGTACFEHSLQDRVHVTTTTRRIRS
jgi:hypothetical protein